MKLYRFSPINDKAHLLQAIEHIHHASYALCKHNFGKYLPNAGNVGVFCHYEGEYAILLKLHAELTESSDNVNQKYFKLHEPIIIPAHGDVPETTYTHLYIRKPDPYRHHVGDVDFSIEKAAYDALKESLRGKDTVKGARIFSRPNLDMIELCDPDVDVLAYVSTKMMSEKVRAKITNA